MQSLAYMSTLSEDHVKNQQLCHPTFQRASSYLPLGTYIPQPDPLPSLDQCVDVIGGKSHARREAAPGSIPVEQELGGSRPTGGSMSV